MESTRVLVSAAVLPIDWCRRLVASRDVRRVGLIISLAAWIGLVVSHFQGFHTAQALFAALGAITWGQVFATFTPTEDGLEYGLISGASSAASLILLGMALVEFRLTAAFLLAFIVAGAVSVVLQLESILRRASTLRGPELPTGSFEVEKLR